MTESKECMVCCESFTKKRPAVQCPFCPDTGPFACLECVKRVITDTANPPFCMQCKHVWSTTFVNKTFKRSFLQKEYVQKRQPKILEREKALFPSTIPLVEEEYRKHDLLHENASLKCERELLMEKVKEVDRRLIKNQRLLMDPNYDGEGVATTGYKARYVMHCPVEECRGYIEATSWMCGICSVKLCGTCHAIKKDTASAPHLCSPEDVKNAKAIFKDTKPCPKCATRISRIDGCDVMFCTECHTGFNWKTGNIETGPIHNPHYFEYLRTHGGGTRAPGDVPCGGVPRMESLRVIVHGMHLEKYPIEYNIIEEEFGDVYSRLCEVDSALRTWNMLRVVDLAWIRVRYLMGEIESEEEFVKMILKEEKKNQKKIETRNILETFTVTTIERLNDLERKCREVVQTKVDEGKKPKAKGKSVGKGKAKARVRSIPRPVPRPIPPPSPESESDDEPIYFSDSDDYPGGCIWRAGLDATVDERYELLKPVMDEIKGIMRFCNASIIETYKALGCYTGPLILMRFKDTMRRANFRQTMRFTEYLGNEDVCLSRGMPEGHASAKAKGKAKKTTKILHTVSDSDDEFD